MYAIVKTGGKQYKVSEGDIIKVDNLNLDDKATVEFEVVALNDGDLKVGDEVKEAKVNAEVINSGRDRKVIAFVKRRRKDSKVKRGFRRSFTRVKITKIAA